MRTLVEAQSKDEVLSALSKATKELRARLGESLGSIQRFAAPLEEGTTSSLEALKAVSLAREQFLKGNRIEAITLYQHAIELDPKFALPVARLANVYDGLGQSELATKFAEQAYQLRDRTSEREKFLLTSLYYDYVTGEIDKEVELLKLWTQTYPRDVFPQNALVTRYLMLGLFDQGVREANISIQLDPNYVFPPGNLAAGLVRLGRYDEANAALATARERKLDSTFYRAILYRTAFIQGNENLMQQQLDAAKGRPDEFGPLNWHSQALAFNGHLKESAAMAQRSITMAEQRHFDEVAAALTIEAALRQALVGQKKAALDSLTKTLANSRQSFTRGYRNPVLPPIGPLAFALTGDLPTAQILINKTAQRNTKNVLTQAVWLPVARAALELERGQFAKAIESLEPAIPYESASVFWPTWLRAQAYLKMKKGAEAAAEFQKIIDHRGWEPVSLLYPLAHLGLARAASLQNNRAQSRSEQEKFFSMWKDADANLPVFIDAKKEFEQLR